MTMHLCGPALSLNGKKKGKPKFRNAEEARRARELAADWEQLKAKYGVTGKKERRVAKVFEPLHTAYRLTTPPGRETERHASRTTPGHSTARIDKVYTGGEMIGIGQLHKSNAIPIFKKSDAEDLAKMRR